jgi:hypothetical protein
MNKWEYKIISPEVEVKGWVNRKVCLKEEQILNELGNDGWELVGIAPFAGNTTVAWGAGTGNFILIFKRLKA